MASTVHYIGAEGVEMLAEPFALTLYRQVKAGKSVEQVAKATGIPASRVKQRVRAAEAFINQMRPDPAASKAA